MKFDYLGNEVIEPKNIIEELEAKNVELEKKLQVAEGEWKTYATVSKSLSKKLEIAVEALESIASFRCGEPVNRFISKDFWIGIGVNKCAESCVADTECAREALAAIKDT